ncbi:hypothetical protein [Alkalibacter mobilis]|uniref:hypothetical protein n=1 Tax=Alkalibacter mobilis TaxID=2787712 RepID=UPI00189CE6B2|nr:hypothetical protein [Alkalibacter mobilis]MBF7097599.1 hypothetical protein [Alkalibacter mobilis]
MNKLKTVEKISAQNRTIQTRKEFAEAYKELISFNVFDNDESRLVRNLIHSLDELILHYEYKDLANKIKIKVLLEGRIDGL